MTCTMVLKNGYNVQLSLNPTNTYSIIRKVGNFSKLLISGIAHDKIESTITLILDNEVPTPNQEFIIEQD